jgi:cell wall-associated NlpC family hydrolase
MLNRITVLAFVFFLSFSTGHGDIPSSAETASPSITPKGVDRTALITYAKRYLGSPYRIAGRDPKKGFDCSGFVSFVFREFNLELPRSSRDYRTLGQALKPGDFRVGDVVVFYGFIDRTHIGHVGIICEANGMKSKFIHASSGKAHCVTISDLDSEGYHARFYKCIDVIRK